jgi:ectoine hydroxylase-related dioxygenase (phytanoyl-CoA dioxygenase family)
MLAEFRRDGYVILPSLLSASEVRELALALAPYEEPRPMGRSNFEGELSKRVYSLAGKGGVFMRLAEHPRIVEILDQVLLPNWLLSNLQSIRLFPGETCQPWHADDAFYLVPRPHPSLAVSVIWALEDFTDENGATELIAGSHAWRDERPDQRPHEVRKARMPAGSALVFDGSLWHRGGANTTEGTRLCISPQYCQPWLRPQESQLLIAPPDVARRYSARGRAMLGYSIHPPFVGQVDGMHPLRVVDPEYRTRKTDDRAIADAVLLRPEAAMSPAPPKA